MAWHLSSISALGFAAVGVHAALVAVGWRHRESRCGTEIAALHVLVGLSALAYAIQIGFGSVAMQRRWWQVTFALSTGVPILWLVVVVQYVSRSQWLTVRRAALLALEPLAVLIATATNPMHHLVWTVPSGPTVVDSTVQVAFGPLYYLHVVFAYTAVAIGMGLILLVGVRMSLLYWKQVAVLTVAPLPPFLSHVAFLLGMSPIPGVDLTSFTFAITGVLVVLGLYHFDLLERVPVARRRAFEAMGDGLVVLDSDRVVVEVDDTARRVLDPPPDPGDHVSDVFPEHAFEDLKGTTVTDGRSRAYDIRLSELSDERGDEVGYALALRDVTGRHRYEQRLEVANRILRHNLRNDMNVVRGYADIVASGTVEDAERAAESILSRTDDLLTVSDKARKVSELEDTHSETPTVHDVTEIVASAVRRAERGYPDVEFAFDGDAHARAALTDANSIGTATEELIELLVTESDSEGLRVRVSVEREATADSEPSIAVRFASSGDGIPEVERRALDAGSETPLQHAEGLGLWLAYWCVIENGGELRFADGSGGSAGDRDAPVDGDSPGDGVDSPAEGTAATDLRTIVTLRFSEPDE
ncbi:histidine kinase N-terminal 7TM domain-containing protein [Halobellus rubicundus]|uniref:Histidine kinase N-terminal 7TM domain-containing protein n=1 Tax=Halobellus rubicundus TaxID=2996466 RepID=A0ABD5MCU6_9EURY